MGNLLDIDDIEYAPADSNIATLLARREFLLAIAGIEPRVVNELFLIWSKFLEATKHIEKINDQDKVLVECLSLIGLVSYVKRTEGQLDVSTAPPSVSELQNDFNNLLSSLTEWCIKNKLWENWCCEFGKNVLTHFWREEINRKPIFRLIELEERKERGESKPSEYQAPESYKSVSDFYFESWVIIADEMLKDAKLQLIVPEYLGEIESDPNRLPTSLEIPKKLLTQPPIPPSGLPQIAEGTGTLTSKKCYLETVKLNVELHMGEGIAKELPLKVREKIVQQMFDAIKPTAIHYWDEYIHYLMSHDWVKIKRKRKLEQHCEWLVLYLLRSNGDEEKEEEDNEYNELHEDDEHVEPYENEEGKIKRRKSIASKVVGKSLSHQAVYKALDELAKLINLRLENEVIPKPRKAQ